MTEADEAALAAKRSKSENQLEGPVTRVPVELPERHALVRCPSCHRVTDAARLAANLQVCPRCGHHLRVGAWTRLAMTVDEGSFEEWDAGLSGRDFLNFPGYRDKLHVARRRTGERDAVVTGRATIGGLPCALFVMDSEFMMGSMGAVVGEKITRAFERSVAEGLPVVGFTVSGGARMQEGVTSLMQMTKVTAAVRRHAEAGLAYLCVLTDPTSGGVTASFAMEGDVTLAEPGALVAFAGPRVIEQTTHKRLPAGFQRAEFQLDHGFVDMVVERRDLPATLALLLAYHARGGFVAPDPTKVPEAVAEAAQEDGAADAAAAVAEAAVSVAARATSDVAAVGSQIGRRILSLAGVGERDEAAADGGTEAAGAAAAAAAGTGTGGGADDERGHTAYELLERVRSGQRGTVLPLMGQVFDGFVELHGDRRFGDDGAVVAGLALLGGRPVTVIGTERGTTTKERVARNFGSASPEGYRKAQRLMAEAERFGRPVVCLVDTSGAYCGMGAEERGQGEAIATSLWESMGLRVPVVSLIVGEGGSGGALALASGDVTLMLSGAIYSVVSPEGAASILWKDSSRAPEAAEALHITAPDLLELGIVDEVIDDAGLGSDAFARSLAERLAEEVDRLSALPADELVERRYRRFRRMGEAALCR